MQAVALKFACVALYCACVAQGVFVCNKGFVNLDGQCVLFAEYSNVCATPADCTKYFGNEQQCDANQNCGWTFGAASSYCNSFGPGYNLVKVNNQYQNNAYNTLKGEGTWNLAWIGASCKSISDSTGKQTAAWVWLADGQTVIDGYQNFDWSIDPTTCTPNQCVTLGGTGYNGKWQAGVCNNRMGDAICAENFNTDAPTPAPNVPLTCPDGWFLFPDPKAVNPGGRLGPAKCYQLLSQINGVTQEFSWLQAKKACEPEGATLPKIEDTATNNFVNGALGQGAYSLQWIGARCVLKDGAYRFRWVKDNGLVAAGYTNFPIDYYSGLEQEINPCNAVTDQNPTGSSDICLSGGGAGYSYQWSTSPCTGQYGDAICEAIPIGGSDDTPQPPKKKSKVNGGAVAAGIFVPMMVVGGGWVAYKYMGGQGGYRGVAGMNTNFISTSQAAAGATDFSMAQAAPAGAASL